MIIRKLNLLQITVRTPKIYQQKLIFQMKIKIIFLLQVQPQQDQQLLQVQRRLQGQPQQDLQPQQAQPQQDQQLLQVQPQAQVNLH